MQYAPTLELVRAVQQARFAPVTATQGATFRALRRRFAQISSRLTATRTVGVPACQTC